ncbi:MBL fold metallo-hydrolase [Hyphococcus flavus]|uniref:MBL fold metallo-hydrolase n=1 Tax=Hyphococcus flavus TaxID=1866326 RepID=A0AAF0CB94_9PROT|nr:MBL fold metallo-hydrolase [Hyphococcus flavus]WDI30340.1 MBL fold metallo-hydrolase [Hyphococcus flavus]
MKATNFLTGTAAFILSACAPEIDKPAQTQQCDVSLLILGVAQDAGKPQIGNSEDPAWADPSLRRLATSIALIDRRGETPKRWLFEATPDIKEQLHRLNEAAPAANALDLGGVFLTHAHIGHYAGLMMFGHEAAGAQYVQVFAMPRMADYLAQNGPWGQLLSKHNIFIAIMSENEPEQLAEDISVTPFLVPHRQEYSEVAGFNIQGPNKSAIFIPDIDSWEDWDAQETRIENKIAEVDYAFLDATFFANGEIPGRDMSGFPHPFVSHSMERFAPLPDAEKSKVWFIHMNHTNPLLNPRAPERAAVNRAGFNIADEGQEICL